MQLYNSLTKQKEAFQPLKPGQVTIYSCGPTVYDHAHIGNFRAFIFADTLSRTLRANSFGVTQVMNLTDVDDKTIKKSREIYPDLPPKEALQKLTRHYEEIFHQEAAQVGIDTRNYQLVRATEHIEDMQALIRQIPMAYGAEDGIYFNIDEYVKKYPYGELTKVDLSGRHQQARIANDEYDKDSPHDFALWKKAKAGEPAWDYEWDGVNLAGYPGWHIECSAMSTKYLGQPFDIHTGGVDLKFPHHENEIAQSRAAKGGGLANYWLHNEHVLVDGKKMAKSTGNFHTLENVVGKGYEPLAFRLLTLQAHYRSQLNFTWDSLQAAANLLGALQGFADLCHQPKLEAAGFNFKKAQEDITKALEDDLNTPQALAILAGLVDEVVAISDQAVFTNFLKFVDQVFGLSLSTRLDITEDIKILILEREAARNNEDYAKADSLRQKLEQEGTQLKDTPFGAIWSRT